MSAIQQVLMAIVSSVFLPSDLIADASAESFSDQPASAVIVLGITAGGLLTLEYSASGTLPTPAFPVSEQYTWLVGGTSSLYSIRMRRTSGSSFSFGSTAIDTWVPMTTDRTWILQSASNSSQPFNSKAVTAVLELAYTNNLTNILAQSDITFSTSASTQGGFIP